MTDQVIEWAPFRLRTGVDESTLLAASERLQAEFLDHQEGFVRRELVKRADGEYVDVVWWRSLEAAEKAMARVAESPTCSAYFAVMGTNDANAGDGVLHYHSVRSYPAAA